MKKELKMGGGGLEKSDFFWNHLPFGGNEGRIILEKGGFEQEKYAKVIGVPESVLEEYEKKEKGKKEIVSEDASTESVEGEED